MDRVSRRFILHIYVIRRGPKGKAMDEDFSKTRAKLLDKINRMTFFVQFPILFENKTIVLISSEYYHHI